MPVPFILRAAQAAVDVVEVTLLVGELVQPHLLEYIHQPFTVTNQSQSNAQDSPVTFRKSSWLQFYVDN
jgi:hypothetical protein